MSTKDQKPPRRNRVYGAHDLPGARSSGLSLISNATGVSNNSAGSASTITQDSYSKSKYLTEKKKKTRRRSDGERKAAKNTAEAIRDAKDMDVFEFLIETDQPELDQPEPAQPEMEMKNSLIGLVPKPDIVISSDESDTEGFYKSQLSDSGISMGSSLGDVHFDSCVKQPLPPLIEETSDYTTYVPPAADHATYTPPTYSPTLIEPTYAPTIADALYHHEPHMWAHYPPTVYTPEPMPLSPASIRSHAYPHEYSYRDTPEPPSTGESSISCLDSAPLVFREKCIRTTPHPQLFRSFAKLNTRVLLQMQSNITDLEHELLLLDNKTLAPETSAKRRKGEYSNSRRFSKDQAHRADLYQELHTSLEQYYEALSSYHKMAEIVSPSRPSDTTSLKSWLQTCVAPSSRLPSLVGDGSDLVRLGRPPNETSEHILRVIAYCVLTDIFVPLLLFKLSSGVLSRLIILSLATTLGTLILDRHRVNAKVDLGNLHWHCTLGCAGVSLIAALLF